MQNLKAKAKDRVAHAWKFHKGTGAWTALTLILTGFLMSAAIGIQREKIVLPAWFLGFTAVFSLAVGTAALYLHMISDTYESEQKAELSAKSEDSA